MPKRKKKIIVSTSEEVDSSFTLQNGALICFYSTCNYARFHNIHRFFEYTTKNSFNSFVQWAVDAWRQSDEHPNSSVVAAPLKVLANTW